MTWKPSRPGVNCGPAISSRPCGLTVAFCRNFEMTSALTSAPFCLLDQTTSYSGLASGLGKSDLARGRGGGEGQRGPGGGRPPPPPPPPPLLRRRVAALERAGDRVVLDRAR